MLLLIALCLSAKLDDTRVEPAEAKRILQGYYQRLHEAKSFGLTALERDPSGKQTSYRFEAAQPDRMRRTRTNSIYIVQGSKALSLWPERKTGLITDRGFEPIELPYGFEPFLPSDVQRDAVNGGLTRGAFQGRPAYILVKAREHPKMKATIYLDSQTLLPLGCALEQAGVSVTQYKNVALNPTMPGAAFSLRPPKGYKVNHYSSGHPPAAAWQTPLRTLP